MDRVTATITETKRADNWTDRPKLVVTATAFGGLTIIFTVPAHRERSYYVGRQLQVTYGLPK